MATKIRLQRHGKKGKPFYHIVVTDSRARRDGKYIERIGFYNPTTIPASIDLDVNRALHWVQVGAEPTDTAHAILKYKGVLYKNHLMKGVAKGAFSIEVAETMFEEWVANKQTEIDHKRTKHKEEKASHAAALATAGREAAIAKNWQKKLPWQRKLPVLKKKEQRKKELKKWLYLRTQLKRLKKQHLKQ
jgi:small subunit ribosomal protein S16